MKRFFIFMLLLSAVRADTIATNNAALLAGLSPANWQLNGATYIRAINPGAYIKVNFTGTTVGVTIDISSYTPLAAKQYPRIKYSIDGGAFTTYQTQSTDTGVITMATGLPDATHSLDFQFIASDAYIARWSGLMSCTITSFTVGIGKTFAAATMLNDFAIFFGDSITEGAWTLGSPGAGLGNYALYDDSSVSYAKLISTHLNIEYSACAFGGQSWEVYFNLDIPPLPTAYNSVLSGVGRTFGNPGYVFINMGQNGAPSSGTVGAFLTALRNATGPRASIHLIIPFSGANRTEITSQWTAWKATHATDRSKLIDLGATGETITTDNSTDGVHLNPTGYTLIADAIEPLIDPPIASGGATVSGTLTITGTLTLP